MSRTRHHRCQRDSHRGKDLWSRRAGMGHQAYSTYNKKLTAQRERMEENEIVIKELKEYILKAERKHLRNGCAKR
jgi:hypothetical protein